MHILAYYAPVCSYSIQDTLIKEVTRVKYLGVTLGSGVIYGPTLQRIQRLKIYTSSNSKL